MQIINILRTFILLLSSVIYACFSVMFSSVIYSHVPILLTYFYSYKHEETHPISPPLVYEKDNKRVYSLSARDTMT